MKRTDPEIIAARLGISAAVVRRLQARGHLTRFDLSDAEIRDRVYAAHVRAMTIDDRNQPNRRAVP